jgi:hypothetical protein
MNEHAFAVDVVARIERATNSASLTFGELVRFLPGVDPAVVRDNLANGASALSPRVRWVKCAEPAPLDPRLPIPHPLDFDWRFTPESVAALADKLRTYGSRVALLGAPSLWLALRDRGHVGAVHLLDANPLPFNSPDSDCESFVRHMTDVLADVLPGLSPVDVVVADPPWYPEAHRGFLWAGAHLLRPGGILLASLPPVGTRPGVLGERESLLDWSRTLGLTLRSTGEGALRYSMPPFEHAALKAAGLAAFVPGDWRQGDLVSLERTGEVVAPRPVHRRQRWTERAIEGVRIQIDADARPTGVDPGLISIVEGDVLSSVSRRDPRRTSARVWTSGNRVFGCAAPARLVGVIDDLVAGSLPDEPVVLRAARAIQALVHSERREYICSDGRGALGTCAP